MAGVVDVPLDCWLRVVAAEGPGRVVGDPVVVEVGVAEPLTGSPTALVVGFGASTARSGPVAGATRARLNEALQS